MELSENVPVAVNCSVVPVTMVGLAGVTAMDTSVADVTVRVAEPVTLPETAVILTVPGAAVVTSPVELTVAADVDDELQLVEVDVVRSCWLPSEYVPVAEHCSVIPEGASGSGMVTEMETRVGEEGDGEGDDDEAL